MKVTTSTAKPELLIVDDNEPFVSAMESVLGAEYLVRTADSESTALESLSPSPDAVLLDVRLREDDADNQEGVSLLKKLRLRYPDLPIIMVTGYGDVKTAVQCMQLGAADFIDKDSDDLDLLIQSRLALVLKNSRNSRKAKQAQGRLDLIEPREIVGESAQLRQIKKTITAVAQDGRITVLIRGETGTGKELVARAIHASGIRSSGPFVAVTGIPATLIESELFGSEAGAFTDAREKKIGYLETAHRGVLFLDEIGDVDVNFQYKLLRFLQEREFNPLGSTKTLRVDIQVVAATNSDLEVGVREGRFRKDLYYRLRGHEIVIPPLRERRDDIPLLVALFLKLQAQRGGRISEISASAADWLQRQQWPGNVRQLSAAIDSALINSKTKGHTRIELDDFPKDDLDSSGPIFLGAGIGQPGFKMKEALNQIELTYIRDAIRMAHGKKMEAWKLLGYNSRRQLDRRLQMLSKICPRLAKESLE
ncbi:MAG TPA: sigma-54 dependent transcriptional regulator [Candidatus Angelobacter sp.]